MGAELSESCDELRVSLDRLRTLLENLVVRGLRACGEDEMAQLRGYTQELDQAGAGHVPSILAELQTQIAASDRAAPRTLVMAQTSVRMLERLLTLRVAQGAFAISAAAAGDAMDEMDEEEDEEA